MEAAGRSEPFHKPVVEPILVLSGIAVWHGSFRIGYFGALFMLLAKRKLMTKRTYVW